MYNFQRNYRKNKAVCNSEYIFLYILKTKWKNIQLQVDIASNNNFCFIKCKVFNFLVMHVYLHALQFA